MVRKYLNKKKLKRSKELLYALYLGWRLRKILKESNVLNSLMDIQDINAYLEELQEVEDTETIEQTKAERRELIEKFIQMLNRELAFRQHSPKSENMKTSKKSLANQTDQKVSSCIDQ